MIKWGIHSLTWWYLCYKYGCVDIFDKWVDDDCDIFDVPTVRYGFGPVFIDVAKGDAQ